MVGMLTVNIAINIVSSPAGSLVLRFSHRHRVTDARGRGGTGQRPARVTGRRSTIPDHHTYTPVAQYQSKVSSSCVGVILQTSSPGHRGGAGHTVTAPQEAEYAYVRENVPYQRRVIMCTLICAASPFSRKSRVEC